MPQIENGSQGEIVEITADGNAVVQFDDDQQRLITGEVLASLRLAYARHVCRAPRARPPSGALVVTSGWQRYVNREDPGTYGHDLDRIGLLAERMGTSCSQTPSLAGSELPDTEWCPDFNLPLAPSRRPLSDPAVERLAEAAPSQ